MLTACTNRQLLTRAPVDLEHRFKSVTDGHGATLSPPVLTPASSPGTQLLPAGRLEQLPPQALMDELYGWDLSLLILSLT